MSIDTIQAFTGVRKCLSYDRVRRCAKCNGENPVRCKACKSTGILRQTTQLNLPIPSQVRDGVLLRLRNRGHEALDGESGDLIVQINVREHERYSH
jgi:molecular chaperone DnaJ